jgi:hypothetical protein
MALFNQVVYYKTQAGTGTYLYKGASTSIGTLDTSWASSSEFQVGRGDALRITVQAVFNTVTSIDVQLACKRIDDSGVAWLWEPVMTVPLHSGVPTLTPNLLAAVFVTADSTASAVALATPDHHLSGTCKLLIRANGAVGVGDSLIVAVTG